MKNYSPEHHRDLLAIEYLLGLTDGDDVSKVSELLASDDGFLETVSRWQVYLSELDSTALPAVASEELWKRIEDALDTSYDVGTTPQERANRRQARIQNLLASLSFWRWFAAGALTAALGLFAVLITLKPAQPALVAVLSTDSGKPGAIVETFANGRVRLIPLQSIDVPSDRALQVWTLRDRGEGPISVGLIDKAKTIRLDLGSLPKPNPDQLFEITLEPKTGSPTNKPTGPVLMKGLANPTL